MYQSTTTHAENGRAAEPKAAELKISKIDLDYAYGQMMLSEETSRRCVIAITGGNFSGYNRFRKGFYGLTNIPTIFEEKLD